MTQFYSSPSTGINGRLSRLYILVCLLLLPLISQAQLTGPGGVSSGIKLWLDAGNVNNTSPATNPSNGSTVSVWKDISGNGNNATVLSGQGTPVISSSQINGKDVIKFTRSTGSAGTVYEVPGVDIRATAMAKTTIFTVYRQGTNNSADWHGIWGDDNGGWDRFFMPRFGSDNGIVSVGPPTNNVAVAGAGVVGTTKLLTAVYDNGTTNGSTIYFNAIPVQTVTDNSSATAAQSDLRIGWDGDDNPYNGDIAELIVYNRKLTDCEIKTVNKYLGYKYGVTFSTVTLSPASKAYYCTASASSVTLTATSGTAGATFTWLNNGALISGATSSTYNATSYGSYQAIATVGGCSDTSAPTVVYPIGSRMYVDSSVAVSGSGQSWTSPLKTVSEALEFANGTTCGVEIWVRKGTYYPMTASGTVASSRDSSFRILRNNIKLYGGFAGGETSTGQRVIASNPTMLSGDINVANDSTDNSYHVVTIIATPTVSIDSSTVIDGFTIQRGTANGGTSIIVNGQTFNAQDGGGVYVYGAAAGSSAAPKFENVTFSNNMANFGAGLYLTGGTTGGASPVISACTFRNNNVTYYGGGFVSFGSTRANSIVRVRNSTFSYNKASNPGSYGGGAACYLRNSQLYMDSSSVSNNSAPCAAGVKSDHGRCYISNCTFSSDSVATVNYTIFVGTDVWGTAGAAGFHALDDSAYYSNCVFTGNYAGFGGAIFVTSIGATNTLVNTANCRFVNNSSISYGGAVANIFGGLYYAQNSVFTGTNYGAGAIGAYHTSATPLSLDSLTQCVMTDNVSNGAGYIDGNARLSLLGCTLSNNDGGAGSRSLYQSSAAGQLRLENTIVWGPSLTHVSSANLVMTNSLIRNSAATLPNVVSSPQFINASDPDGPDNIWGTADDGLHISWISSALNDGSNTLAASLPTDFAGATRIQNTTVDIGAYEGSSIVCPSGTRLYVDSSLITSGDGTSWPQAFKTVWEALTVANTCPSVSEIWVKKATYTPMFNPVYIAASRDSSLRILRNGVKIYGGFSGTETALSQRNIGTNTTILSGDIGTAGTTSDNSSHVMTILAPAGGSIDTTTVVSGFTITAGNANSSGYTYNAIPIIGGDGGGILNAANNSGAVNKSLIEYCTFYKNLANVGAGMYCGGYTGGVSSPVVRNCQFYQNTALDVAGLHARAGNTGGLANPAVYNCIFKGNSANQGGAMGAYSDLGGSANPTAYNCVFDSNVVANTGGAFNIYAGSFTATNCVFANNRGTGTGGGGGAINIPGGQTATFYDCTFYGNTTASTARPNSNALLSSGTLNLNNTIVWGTATNQIDNTGTANYNYSDLRGITASGTNLNIDPQFVNTADPDGADNTWATADDGLSLLPCSPVIAAGSNSLIPAGITSDLIGAARIQQSTVDMGAYESPYVFTPTVTPSVTLSVNPVGAICSGTSVTFTATGVNGGSTPLYQWLVNGVVAGTGPTFTSTTLTNGATVQVRLITSVLCRTIDTAYSTAVTMVVNPTPVISSTSFTNPTTCGGTDGTISLSGLTPASGYTLNYALNGIAQPPLAISANGSGVIVMTGLGAGSYSSFSVSTSAPCRSQIVAGPIVLVPPTAPSISSSSSTDPTTCGGTNGTISLNGLVAGTTYTVSYTKNGAAQTATITANGSGVVVISGLTIGTYTNISLNRLGCASNVVAGPIVLNPPPTPSITSTSFTDPLTCGGTTGTITLNGLSAATAYSVSYTKNSGTPTTLTIISNASGSVVITGLTQGSYTNLSVTLSACQSSIIAGPVTLTDPPVPPAPGASSNSPLCQGGTLNLSATGLPGAAYSWTGPAGYSSATQNPVVTTNMQAVNAGTYSVTQTVAGCVSPAAATTVVMSTVPAAPGAISGNAAPCLGSSYTYTTSGSATATTYVWTIPSTTGWSGSSSNTSITVTAGAAGGTLSVAGINGCGTGPATTLALTPNAVPATPGAISGPATVCVGTSVNYFVTPVSNTSSYTWTIPTGWSAAGTTTSSIIATAPGAAGTGTISVIANNVCGSSPAQNISVAVITAPAQPGAISGSATPCISSPQTYSISAVSGATTYAWSYPSGGIPAWVGGSNTTSITTLVGTNSGNVSVSALNQCGSSPITTLAVVVTQLPGQPGSITGKTAPCVGAFETYKLSTPSAGATSYIWTYPSAGTPAWSGAGTGDSLNVTVGGSGGTINVTPLNQCGTGPSGSFTVSTTPVVTSGVSLVRSTPTDTICATTPVTFTATATGGGSSPTYVFRKNGTVVAQGPNSAYTDYSLSNGDVVSVTMISSLPCVTLSQAKDSLKTFVLPVITPGISINSVPPTTLCSGTTLTFTTTTVGGGNSPSYQWYKNGVALGVTTPTYATAALADGDTIQVTMLTTAVCPAFLTAYSNKVGITVASIVNPTITVSTSLPGGGGSPYTPGTPVIFTAVESGGGAGAVFQWIKNGVDIIGANGTSYSASGLALGDQISVRMISSLSCAKPGVVSSNIVTMAAQSTGIGNGANGNGWDGVILLYPNPSSGHFTISAEWEGSHSGKRVSIELISSLGQSVYHTELQPTTKAWSTDVWLDEQIANGTYMVHISSEDGLYHNIPVVIKR